MAKNAAGKLSERRIMPVRFSPLQGGGERDYRERLVDLVHGEAEGDLLVVGWGSTKGAIEGLEVAIVGDISHSRVARSNIFGLRALGAEVGVCGPRSLVPVGIEDLGVRVFGHVEEAIEWADVLNVLRLQLERMDAGFIPSLREYNRVFGVTRVRLERAPREVVVLHPGPMNRGVEIDSDVADGPHSVILNQVTNGVAVRMAVLYLLAGGQPESAEAAKQGAEA